MAQSYVWPSSSANVSISAIGTNGLPAPATSIQIAGQDLAGNLIPALVDTNGELIVEVSSSTLPTGGATSANQTLEIAQLTAIDGKLPSALGSQVTADSLAVNIASDQVVPVSVTSLPLPTGAATSANQTTEIGHLANIDAATTSIEMQLPPALGAQVTASSLAVNIASDQTVPVSATSLPLPSGASTSALQTQISGQLAASLPLPTGASTSALQTQISGQLPTTLGQKASAASLAVVIASDQSALPVTGGFYQAVQPVNVVTGPALTITQAAITIGTTAVRLTVSGSAPSADRVSLVFTPDKASTGLFYIGSSSVTSSGATAGIQIQPGQSFIANDDAADYWVISDTAAQTGYVMEQA